MRPYIIPQQPVNDVNELFHTSGAFLHLSRSEGLSYALLEAIYAGLPVICSSIPENEPVSACPSVHYVDIECAEQVYIEMKRVIDCGFKSDRHAVDESRREIERLFSLDSWSKKITEVYFSNT